MHYLDIINKVLIELNYKPVSSFKELCKQDHLKIKNTISRLNLEICSSYDWNFLLRKQSLNIPLNLTQISNPIFGRIDNISIDGFTLKFDPDFKKFLFGNPQPYSFSIFSNYLLFPKFSSVKQASIFYFTNNSAVNDSGFDVYSLSDPLDKSLLPLPFSEIILVYGSCMKFKGNSQHVKFKYWFSMYNEALANLRKMSVSSVSQYPSVRILSKRFI